MRTKSQIKSILYNSLSDPRWISLRDAHIGSEFVSIATEIVYNYELSFDKYGIDEKSIADIKEELSVAIADGPVKDALLTWMATAVYEVRDTVNKGHLDTDWRLCTNYASLIKHATALDFPVMRKAAAYLMVQLPAGNKSYKPYEVAISAGSAVFYNIAPCRSGEQVVLYQGVPYVFVHGKDSSTYPDAQDYNVSLRFSQIASTSQYECYAPLPKDTYPESIEVFVNGEVLPRYRYRSGTGSFNVITSADDSKLVYMTRKVANGSIMGENFSVDAKSWCIRFLSLTFIEFDRYSVQLPDGYVYLMSGNSLETLDYQKNYFARQLFANYLKQDLTDIVRMTCDSFPGVLDSSVEGACNGKINVYIKPSHENTNVLFTDLEHYLNNNRGTDNSVYYTMSAEHTEFSFILSPNRTLNESLRGRVEDFLREKYSYESLKFADSVSHLDVERAIANLLGISYTSTPPVSVDLRISHTVVDMEWVDSNTHAYTSNLKFMKNGVQKGWSDSSKIYYVRDTIQNYVVQPAHMVLTSNACQASVYTDLNHSTQPTTQYMSYDGHISAGYVDASADPDISTLYRNRWYLGSNCAVAFNSGMTEMYLADLDDVYFSNPCNVLGPAYETYSVDSQVKTSLQNIVDGACAGGAVFTRDRDELFGIARNQNSNNTTLMIYDLLQDESLAIFGSVAVCTPAPPTSISAYNGYLYISSDDASITLYKYTDMSRSYKSFRLQDSFGNVLPSTDVPWKWTQTIPATASDEVWNTANFNLIVDSKGRILIVSLDASVPSTDRPEGITEEIWNSYNKATQQRINSKWNVYIADSFKATLTGFELINLRQLDQMPTYHGYGRNLFVACGGICSPTVSFVYVSDEWAGTWSSITSNRYTIHSFHVYDYDTETISESEVGPVEGIEGSTLTDFFRCYNHTTSQVGTYTILPSSVILTDGSPMLSTFSVHTTGVDSNASCYVKLSKQDIIWDL